MTSGWNNHGYWISDTGDTEPTSEQIKGSLPAKARCGGPKMCRKCTQTPTLFVTYLDEDKNATYTHVPSRVVPVPEVTLNSVLQKYAAKLGEIYLARTAGDYTFHGVLYEFLSEANKIQFPKIEVDTGRNRPLGDMTSSKRKSYGGA